MSAKMATPGLVKIMVFWKRGYEVVILVDKVASKILSRDSNYIVDVFRWPKFGNSSYERSYHNLNFIRIWPNTLSFLRGGLSSCSVIWHWHWVQNWHFTPMWQKSQKVFGANSYVCRGYKGKTGRGGLFFGSPHPE